MGMGKNAMVKLGIFGELLSFLWRRKRWWLIPVVVILVIFGIFIIVGGIPGVAPFIYTLF